MTEIVACTIHRGQNAPFRVSHVATVIRASVDALMHVGMTKVKSHVIRLQKAS